jgi:hypothetical protein
VCLIAEEVARVLEIGPEAVLRGHGFRVLRVGDRWWVENSEGLWEGVDVERLVAVAILAVREFGDGEADRDDVSSD